MAYVLHTISEKLIHALSLNLFRKFNDQGLGMLELNLRLKQAVYTQKKHQFSYFLTVEHLAYKR